MKGIILAGGKGTRLHPHDPGVSKQLLPVYDKPMIYYPLSVLMLAGIRDILVISSPQDLPQFRALLGDGTVGHHSPTPSRSSRAGSRRPSSSAPDIGDDSVALILGDNIFYGHGFQSCSQERAPRDGARSSGTLCRIRSVTGSVEIDERAAVSLEEKPAKPRSNRAITGLYLYDNEVRRHRRPAAFARGELEITDVNLHYLARDKANLVDLGRGFTWLDTGTHDSLLEAGKYIQVLEHRQGLRIACVEEVALRMGFIDTQQCHRLGERLGNSGYGRYIMDVAESLRDAGPDKLGGSIGPNSGGREPLSAGVWVVSAVACACCPEPSDGPLLKSRATPTVTRPS